MAAREGSQRIGEAGVWHGSSQRAKSLRKRGRLVNRFCVIWASNAAGRQRRRHVASTRSSAVLRQRARPACGPPAVRVPRVGGKRVTERLRGSASFPLTGTPEQPDRRSKAGRLRAAFAGAHDPMLIVDDQRWCVAANPAACALLGLSPQDVAWHRFDDFIGVAEHAIERLWEAVLENGAVSRRQVLCLPTGDLMPVRFSATAHALPGRHLLVFRPLQANPRGDAVTDHGMKMRAIARREDQPPLTEREHEVLELVAAGLQNSNIAERLFVSAETVKSHLRNILFKLDARTRAQAVAIALRAGQIGGASGPPDSVRAGQHDSPKSR